MKQYNIIGHTFYFSQYTFPTKQNPFVTKLKKNNVSLYIGVNLPLLQKFTPLIKKFH